MHTVLAVVTQLKHRLYEEPTLTVINSNEMTL